MSRVTSANPNNSQGIGGLNTVSATNAANITTTSTTTVSSGFGVTTVGLSTGRFLVLLSIELSHSVIDTGVTFQVWRVGSATIPANGSANTGTQVTGTSQIISPVAAQAMSTGIAILDTPGLGTFSYYVAYFANAAGTATIFGAAFPPTTITVIEI